MGEGFGGDGIPSLYGPLWLWGFARGRSHYLMHASGNVTGRIQATLSGRLMGSHPCVWKRSGADPGDGIRDDHGILLPVSGNVTRRIGGTMSGTVSGNAIS